MCVFKRIKFNRCRRCLPISSQKHVILLLVSSIFLCSFLLRINEFVLQNFWLLSLFTKCNIFFFLLPSISDCNSVSIASVSLHERNDNKKNLREKCICISQLNGRIKMWCNLFVSKISTFDSMNNQNMTSNKKKKICSVYYVFFFCSSIRK